MQEAISDPYFSGPATPPPVIPKRPIVTGHDGTGLGIPDTGTPKVAARKLKIKTSAGAEIRSRIHMWMQLTTVRQGRRRIDTAT